MTRSEYVEWCKARALPYVEVGDLNGAFASMASDLKARPETKQHPAIGLGFKLLLNGHLDTPEKMRRFIRGFN
jgi:hypothetical protein